MQSDLVVRRAIRTRCQLKQCTRWYLTFINVNREKQIVKECRVIQITNLGDQQDLIFIMLFTSRRIFRYTRQRLHHSSCHFVFQFFLSVCESGARRIFFLEKTKRKRAKKHFSSRRFSKILRLSLFSVRSRKKITDGIVRSKIRHQVTVFLVEICSFSVPRFVDQSLFLSWPIRITPTTRVSFSHQKTRLVIVELDD